ncbi:hypothetical protein ACH492_32095 [Streptomyces sp. NPDC019443]|uniref:hypothetical protein n=1 Tax=Streptomyces sp. NPDC019443 TaxID=3365061 RepID=UPI00378C5E4A
MARNPARSSEPDDSGTHTTHSTRFPTKLSERKLWEDAPEYPPCLHGHGSYLPRPYQEGVRSPAPKDVELRTDGYDVADELARHPPARDQPHR